MMFYYISCFSPGYLWENMQNRQDVRKFSRFPCDVTTGETCVETQKAPTRNARALSNESTLDGTGNLAGAEAPSTYVDMAGSTVDQSLNTTNVRLPSSVRTSVGVGNLDTKGHALAANIALCHFSCTSLSKRH